MICHYPGFSYVNMFIEMNILFKIFSMCLDPQVCASINDTLFMLKESSL